MYPSFVSTVHITREDQYIFPPQKRCIFYLTDNDKLHDHDKDKRKIKTGLHSAHKARYIDWNLERTYLVSHCVPSCLDNLLQLNLGFTQFEFFFPRKPSRKGPLINLNNNNSGLSKGAGMPGSLCAHWLYMIL